MTRLIDADPFEVFAYARESGETDEFDEGVLLVLEAIGNAPTVDAVEVVRLKEKIDEIVAELDAYCEKAYRDYEETSDYYYVGVARAFESAQQIVEKHLGSDEE